MARRPSPQNPDRAASDDGMVAIGKLRKPRGVHGEINCFPLTDFVERFADLDSVSLKIPDGRRVELKIESAHLYGERLALKFGGVDTPEDVDVYRGALVEVPRGETFDLPENTFYVFEIVGMSVVMKSGEQVGTVTNVLTIPGNDVYVVDRDGEEILLPATRELLTIDSEAGRIIVEELEGLI